MAGANPISTEPKLSEVYKTLKLLANLSRSKANIKPEPPINCQNCQSVLIKNVALVPKTREEILKNLEKTEEQLRSSGQPLPQWIQAYKEGDNMKAAKLLHLHYTAINMKRGATFTDSTPAAKRTRLTLENEVTSTTTIENKMESGADSTTGEISGKKRTESGSRGL